MLGSTLGGSLLIGVSLLALNWAWNSSYGQRTDLRLMVGWGKYMEWMYPVEVRITKNPSFRATGAAVAASL